MQRYWRRGRLSTCCHPQRDDDLHTRVCHAAPRLDTLAHHFHPAPRSQRLIGNQIGSKGAAALADILNKTNVTNLECATANQVFALFLVSALDTRIDTPRSRVADWKITSSAAYPVMTPSAAPTPPRASPSCARGSRRATWPRLSAHHHISLQRPLTHLLSHRSHPAPSLAVSGATTSEPRAPPCSPPSSRRRRSPNWGKPPPQSVRFSVSAR